MRLSKRLVVEIPEDVDEILLEHPSGECEVIPVDFDDDDDDDEESDD
jgi:hypothetical protein